MKNGKNKFIILLLAFMLCTPANALIITHPEEHNMTVDENAIFFSGKIDKYEKVYINGIQIHPEKKTRAFSYSVPLKEGYNVFALQKKDWLLNTETTKYTIKYISPKYGKEHNIFINKKPEYYLTTKDNSIIRSYPVDAGMNRLGYLPKDTKLYIDGVLNEFSRIYLSKDNYAWIMTKDLKIVNSEPKTDNETVDKTEPKTEYKPNQMISTEVIKNNSDITYTITLSDNCPYSAISDGQKLTVTVYNLDNKEESYTKEFELQNFPRYSVCMQNGILYVNLKKNSITPKNYSNKDIKIVIDAGHGGTETGAIGCLGDKEKDINLEVSKALKIILDSHGFNTLMTRDSDKFISLNDRIKFGQDNDALIFISIHLNSVPISSNPNLNRGSIVFYFNPQSKQLAKSLSKTISTSIGTIDGGASPASLAVIRPTEYIGALVELAYLVNPKDVAIYKNKKFVQLSAEAIYKGLADYIHNELEK